MRYKIFKPISILSCLTILFSSCQNLESLHHVSPIAPDQWCKNQPCSTWGDIVISQPSSSIIVYLLAAITLWIAYHFFKTQNGQQSRYWWGVSLLLGGLGAAAAGTSFQAFGYMIKCTNRDFCQLTSWWEIVYNILTVAGAGALLIAVAYSCLGKQWQQKSKGYALLSTVLYTIVCLAGAFLPHQFLVSFELMILFTTPAYLAIVVLHIVQYFKKPTILLRRFLGCWAVLAVTFVAYYLYLANGYTQQFWARGIWFSENDVLHVLMLLWCGYIYFFLSKWVEDKTIA